MFDKQLYRRVLFIGVLLALSVFSGIACATDTETVTETDTTSQAIQSGAVTLR